MIPEKVLAALNDQIRDEFYASMQYLAISAFLGDKNLPGMAGWMRNHADEEHMHAMKIYDFVLDRNARVHLQAIPEPKGEFDSALAAFEAALTHEQHVTASINKIYGMAKEASDYPTEVMLEWFISEQVEEEKLTGDAVAALRMAGDNPSALLMLDAQFGARQPEAEGE